jgi:hypothetical protein
MRATKKNGNVNPHIVIFIIAGILTLSFVLAGPSIMKKFSPGRERARNAVPASIRQTAGTIPRMTHSDDQKIEKPSIEARPQIRSADVPLLADPDFRNIKWGMSPSEVQLHEKIQFTTEVDGRRTVLGGNAQAGGKNCLLIYTFIDDKLVRALYNFAETYTDYNMYYSDYRGVNETLKKMYGKPVEENSMLPRNTRPENIGVRILAGKAGFRTKWNLKNGNYVIHSLYGEKLKVSHWIEFTAYANKASMDKFDAEN